jgi:L-fucose isomerase-like protein
MELNLKCVHVGRRDFIKTTTLAGMAATLPVTSLVAQEPRGALKPSPQGKKRHLLFLTDTPAAYEKLTESIRAIKEYEFEVTPVLMNMQKMQELGKSIQGKDADILLMILPRVTNSSGNIPAAMGDLDIPIVLLPVNLDLIMLEADMAAAFRARGANPMLANSQAHALELIKIAAAPRILEGKKAVIYGRPFDSSSIPARNLSEDFVYKRTGARIQYRPMDELKPLLEGVSEASARKEMERWKKEAVQVVETSDQAILDASRLYVLLRSIVDKEGLSLISIDCLGFSFSANPILPYPCLSFTRLRDDGFAAPCEADVCAGLSSMVLQEISQKPSYFCNVSSVDEQKSSAVLRHCVAPLKLMGREAPQLPYNLRDYHGMGRGVTPEVQFPIGVDVTMGGFNKDLSNFVLWPGRTIARVKDTDRPSFENAPPAYAKMRRYCSNHLEVKIKDMNRFIQSIAGCHHAMVAGSYTNAIREAMLRMNVGIVGPSDLAAPGA